MVTKRLPLEGVLVVSLELAATAPLCTKNLCDLGARVIRVDRPGGDPNSGGGRKALGPWSSVDLWVNPGKEDFTLNLKHPRAREILLRLSERADAVVANLNPNLIAELGLNYELLGARNKKLVVCQISGFGQGGPQARRKAYDLIMQGEAGLIELTGTADTPARVGVAVADTITGVYATGAVLAALYEARVTGVGQQVDVSMLEATASFLGNQLFDYCYQDDLPPRSALRHGHGCPYGVYEASDGRFSIACGTIAMWTSLCKVVGRPELGEDPRYSSGAKRGARQAELDAIFEPIFCQRTVAEWIALLDGAGIACGFVRGLPEVIAHPQLEAREFFKEMPTEWGNVKLYNFPAKFRGEYHSPRSVPPTPGEHTDAILRELGYDEAEIDSLHALEVV